MGSPAVLLLPAVNSATSFFLHTVPSPDPGLSAAPRLLFGFGPWREVVPSRLGPVRPPPGLVGVYEWGCRAPDGSRVIAFYLGKAGAWGQGGWVGVRMVGGRWSKGKGKGNQRDAQGRMSWAAASLRESLRDVALPHFSSLGGGRSRETLRTRFSRYAASTRPLVGPVAERRKMALFAELQRRGFSLHYRWAWGWGWGIAIAERLTYVQQKVKVLRGSTAHGWAGLAAGTARGPERTRESSAGAVKAVGQGGTAMCSCFWVWGTGYAVASCLLPRPCNMQPLRCLQLPYPTVHNATQVPRVLPGPRRRGRAAL